MIKYKWDHQSKEGYNNKTGRYRSNIQLSFIKNNIEKKDYSILDIAGGSGRIAIPLLDYSHSITVADMNEKAIRNLNERNPEISTLCGDFSNMEFKEKFSLVVCIEGPDYFKDWNVFFNKVSSLLTKDGKFIFTYTNPDSWRYILRKFKNRGKHNPYHVVNFKELNKILSNSNLKIEQIEGYNWTPFPVVSNNAFVPFFAFIEKKLGLGKWHSQSPWLMVSVTKQQLN